MAEIKTSRKKFALDIFLQEIEKNFITVQDSSTQFPIFKSVFDQVIAKIKEVDSYFNRYSGKIQYAGSFYDGVKVGQLDEFDMDIVIRLPIDYNEIEIENAQPGFVKLKIGSAFDNLDKQPNWESHHKVIRDWRDSKKYFLQSKFRAWMEGAISKAVNELDRKVIVDGQTYILSIKKSGPAFTVNCRNADTKVAVDVDLVPVIQFGLPRWPTGYQKMEIKGDINKNTWLVVPKPSKGIEDTDVQNRCWRLAFHDQERDIIKGCGKLKPTIRLLKKLRDSLGMKAIASYYIKTLFLWEVKSKDDKYWENKPSTLFKDMVEKFYQALEKKKIPYFWNPGYNLIGAINENVLSNYKNSLKKLIGYLEDNSIADIVKTLLTPEEFDKFRHVEIFENYMAEVTKVEVPLVKKSSSALSLTLNATRIEKLNRTDSKSPRNYSPPTNGNALLENIIKSNQRIENKLDMLLSQVGNLQDRVQNLEMHVKKCKVDSTDPLLDLLMPTHQLPRYVPEGGVCSEPPTDSLI